MPRHRGDVTLEPMPVPLDEAVSHYAESHLCDLASALTADVWVRAALIVEVRRPRTPDAPFQAAAVVYAGNGLREMRGLPLEGSDCLARVIGAICERASCDLYATVRLVRMPTGDEYEITYTEFDDATITGTADLNFASFLLFDHDPGLGPSK